MSNLAVETYDRLVFSWRSGRGFFGPPGVRKVTQSDLVGRRGIDATFSGVTKATKGLVLTCFKLKGEGGYTEFPVPLVVLPPEDQRVFPISGSFQGIEGISAYTHVEKVTGS